jgi:hemerythrin
MEILKWQDAYSVGIKEIDDQHQALLGAINLMLHEQYDSYDEGKFSDALFSLIHYAYTHFATEERYLVQVHFPNLRPHVLEHIGFIMKTLGLAVQVENGEDETRKELLHYLQEWYSSHVLGTDRLYIPYLVAKQSKEEG